MNTSELLAALLDKPVWTPEERREVYDYLETGEPTELMELLRQRYEYDLANNRLKDEGRVNEVYARLEKRMHPELPETTGILQVPILEMKHKSWHRYIATAAILTGVSFGTYFLVQNKKQSPPPVATITPLKNDVAPGGNKAILTLGNGSKIILDSASNGSLAVQGNTNIIKTDSGRLAYQVDKNNSTENPKFSDAAFNTLTTPRGGQYQLQLPDGTKVWLNAASSITYPTVFNGKKRQVTVTGEAYFEVVHIAKQPFEIKAGNEVIEDIGTAFNVNAYGDEKAIRTTLVEGSIKLLAGNQSLIIKPGQQSELTGDQFNVISNLNIDEVTAWKEGSFHFESADLKTILRQFARWYDVEVVYDGTPTNRKFFGIVNRSSSLKKVLGMLRNNNIEYRIENKKLIVKSI